VRLRGVRLSQLYDIVDVNPRFEPQHSVIHSLKVVRRAVQSLGHSDDEIVLISISDLRQLLIEILWRPESDNLEQYSPSVWVFDGKIGDHHLRTQVQHVVFSNQLPLGVRPFLLLGERLFHVRVKIALSRVVRGQVVGVVKLERERPTCRAVVVENVGFHLPAVA